MAKKKTAAITGVGAVCADYILDNIELSHMVDTSDEWIMSGIGMRTRHILKGEGLGTSYMTERAVKDLLERDQNTDPLDIEMVVSARRSRRTSFFPSTANLTCYGTGDENTRFRIRSCRPLAAVSCLRSTRLRNISETGTFKKVVVRGSR